MKNFFSIIILFSISLFVIGCVIDKTKQGLHIYRKSNELKTPNGYVVSKPVKFKLKDKYIGNDRSLISINQLYIENTSAKETWFKFYKDGKVIFGYLCKVPKSEKDEITAWGGYYQIKDTAIIIETTYTQNGNMFANLIIKGVIIGDTLKFYHDQYSFGNWGHNIHHFTSDKYEKHPELKYYIKSNDTFKLKGPDW